MLAWPSQLFSISQSLGTPVSHMASLSVIVEMFAAGKAGRSKMAQEV